MTNLRILGLVALFSALFLMVVGCGGRASKAIEDVADTLESEGVAETKFGDMTFAIPAGALSFSGVAEGEKVKIAANDIGQGGVEDELSDLGYDMNLKDETTGETGTLSSGAKLTIGEEGQEGTVDVDDDLSMALPADDVEKYGANLMDGIEELSALPSFKSKNATTTSVSWYWSPMCIYIPYLGSPSPLSGLRTYYDSGASLAHVYFGAGLASVPMGSRFMCFIVVTVKITIIETKTGDTFAGGGSGGYTTGGSF